MSESKDGGRHTVDHRPPRPTRTILCVLAFALTAGGVRMAGAKRDGPTQPIVTATATVFQQAPDDKNADTPPLDAALLERQILSDENLHRVLFGDDSVDGAGIAKLRHDLQIEVAQTPEPGERRISIGLSGHDAELTHRIVNDLAQQYAADCRASSNRPAREAHQRASAELAAAQQTLVEAQTRLSEFLGRHFDEHRAIAEASHTTESMYISNSTQTNLPPKEVAATETSTVKSTVAPKMIDNPDWTRLEAEISELTRKREELLADLTPLHPTVLGIEDQITGLERRLATIPQRIAAPQSASPIFNPPLEPPPVQAPSVERSGPPPSQIVDTKTAEGHAAAAKDFWTLKRAAEQAAARYEELAQVERQAWQQQCQTPAVWLETAGVPQVGLAGDRSGRLLIVMLTSALAMAAGVGMISSGFSADRPLKTADEVEAKLSIAVVGTIPTGSPSDAVRRGWQQPLSGLGLTLYGVVLVFLCFGILLMAFRPT